MKTGACYIRVSTDDQLEYSPDSQLKAIREYAKKNDIIMPEEFIFVDEGISGRKADKRPAFMQMIGTAKMKPKPFDVILLWKFSRFARNREDSIVYKSMLRKQCGIDVISISEQLGENKTSILIEALIEAMDEYYSVNLAEEVRRGMTEKAKRGEVVSAPPFGYDIENNVFIVNSEQAEIVRMIFNEYINGLGCLEIAKKINNMGVRTKNNNLWENRTIEYVLRNVTYIGKHTWTPNKVKTRDYNNPDTIVTQGKHEAIIDNATFEKVQEMIAEQKRKHQKYERHSPGELMLKGLVRCDNCGATLTYSCNGLQCHRYAKGTCGISHYISLDKINSSVIAALKNDAETQNFHIDFENDLNKTERNDITNTMLAKEYKKLERVKEAYEAGVDTLEEYRCNKQKIMSTITKLEKNLKAVKKPSAEDINKRLTENIKHSLEIIEDSRSSETLKNMTLKSIVKNIVYIKKTGTIEIYYRF